MDIAVRSWIAKIVIVISHAGLGSLNQFFDCLWKKNCGFNSSLFDIFHWPVFKPQTINKVTNTSKFEARLKSDP